MSTLSQVQLRAWAEFWRRLRSFQSSAFCLASFHLTPVDAFARGDILQVLFISLLVGVAVSATLKRDSVIVVGIGELQTIIFKILNILMYLAPIGAFGALAAVVASSGVTTLVYLGRFILIYYAACLFLIFVVFAGITRLAGISLFQILSLIKEEMLLVFSTASGEVSVSAANRKIGNWPGA